MPPPLTNETGMLRIPRRGSRPTATRPRIFPRRSLPDIIVMEDHITQPFRDIEQGSISPDRGKDRLVHVRTIRDFGGVPAAYLEIAQTYSSPLLAGPPLCDELVALVQHMFDPEEADVMRHIKPFSLGMTARSIAAVEKRPEADVAAILERLSKDKCIIMSRGTEDEKRYYLMPLFPGAMENILFRNSREDLTSWHRRFAVLFDALYETGYILDYGRHPAEMVRYLPVQESIASHALAWPSDKLEEILDRFKTFSITYCQCRLTMDLKDEGCGRPLETCVMMGGIAELMVRNGRMRRVGKSEVLEIKKAAEAQGLVTWVGNADSIAGSNVSCSCCGCCCYMLRLITQFSVPAMIAPPHFLPRHDTSRCRTCGACALVCQTGALSVDTTLKTRTYNRTRCIGCGLCVTACGHAAVQLEVVPERKRPPHSVLAYLRRILYPVTRNTMHAFKTHRPE